MKHPQNKSRLGFSIIYLIIFISSMIWNIREPNPWLYFLVFGMGGLTAFHFLRLRRDYKKIELLPHKEFLK